jgi:hypothetical protein
LGFVLKPAFFPWENRGKYWKSLETMGKYGKFIGKSGKIWENLRRSWEHHAKLMGKSSRNLLMCCSWLLKLSVFSR